MSNNNSQVKSMTIEPQLSGQETLNIDPTAGAYLAGAAFVLLKTETEW